MASSATAVNKIPILSLRVYEQLWDSYQSPDGQGTEGDSAVRIQYPTLASQTVAVT